MTNGRILGDSSRWPLVCLTPSFEVYHPSDCLLSKTHSSPCDVTSHKGGSQAPAEVLSPCVLSQPAPPVCVSHTLQQAVTRVPGQAPPPLALSIHRRPFLYREMPDSCSPRSSATAPTQGDGHEGLMRNRQHSQRVLVWVTLECLQQPGCMHFPPLPCRLSRRNLPEAAMESPGAASVNVSRGYK